MSSISNNLNKLVAYKNQKTNMPKYNFNFTEEQMNQNYIINQYEKIYDNDNNYYAKVILLNVKYSKDIIIPMDIYENYFIIHFKDLNNNKELFINDLLSFKSKIYEDIMQDYYNKKNFLINSSFQNVLSYINTEIEDGL